MGVELTIRVILLLKAKVFCKMLTFVGRLAYGSEMSFESLFSCCARRATRLHEAETGSLVSTESDEPTLREEW